MVYNSDVYEDKNSIGRVLGDQFSTFVNVHKMQKLCNDTLNRFVVSQLVLASNQ